MTTPFLLRDGNTASGATAASWRGGGAPTVTKSWARRIPTERSAGAIAQPTRQPVTEYDFEMPEMVIVRSAIPGSVAMGV